MPNYTREDAERKKATAEHILKSGRFPRYLTRADIKANIKHFEYILKRMGSNDSVNIPESEFEKHYNK
jgi:hypothetical protein